MQNTGLGKWPDDNEWPDDGSSDLRSWHTAGVASKRESFAEDSSSKDNGTTGEKTSKADERSERNKRRFKTAFASKDEIQLAQATA